MSFPICMNCDNGIVQHRKQEKGTQEPISVIFCTLMRQEVPPDLAFCSKQESPTSRLSYYDTRPEPTMLNSDRSVKKAVADVLLLMLQARLRP